MHKTCEKKLSSQYFLSKTLKVAQTTTRADEQEVKKGPILHLYNSKFNKTKMRKRENSKF